MLSSTHNHTDRGKQQKNKAMNEQVKNGEETEYKMEVKGRARSRLVEADKKKLCLQKIA